MNDLFFLHCSNLLIKFYIFIDSDWQYRNYQEKKRFASQNSKIQIGFRPRRQTRFNPFADASRRAAALRVRVDVLY